MTKIFSDFNISTAGNLDGKFNGINVSSYSMNAKVINKERKSKPLSSLTKRAHQ
jgi:hypothetical protein